MFQNKTFVRKVNAIIFQVIMFLVFILVGFSCAKKPSGIRTVRQTGTEAIRPKQTEEAQRVSESQGLNYQIFSIERPVDSEDQQNLEITSEIQTPEKTYIPIKATHTKDGKDKNGLIELDSSKKLYIQSRCLNSKDKFDCAVYIMLATVVVNGTAAHQSLAISHKDNENSFYRDEVNFTNPTNMYRTLNSVVNDPLLTQFLTP